MVTSEWLEAQAAIYKVQAKSEAQDDRQLEALHMRLIVEAFRELIARRAADEASVQSGNARPRVFRFTPPCTPIGDAFDEYMLKSYQTLVMTADKSDAIEGAFKAGWDACLAFVARRAANEGAVVVDVSSPGEADAGMRPFTDTVRVSCESGDFGGEADGEFSFAEIFRSFVAEWYDGPAVTIRRRSVEKAGA